MTNYCRAFIPGATYFFTLNLADRRTTLLVDHIDLLREAVRHAHQRTPFLIYAMVVLPDHLHAIWNRSRTRERATPFPSADLPAGLFSNQLKCEPGAIRIERFKGKIWEGHDFRTAVPCKAGREACG